MRYLLDTSVWLRGYFQPETVPAEPRRILASSTHRFGLSAISRYRSEASAVARARNTVDDRDGAPSPAVTA